MADLVVSPRHGLRGAGTADPRRPSRGSLLLETLIALTLLAIAVLLTVSLLTLEARARRARVVRSQVLAAQEAVTEALRSGQLALESVSFEKEELEILLDRPLPPMNLWVEVEETGVSELYGVVVTTRYVAGGRIRFTRLPTRILGDV